MTAESSSPSMDLTMRGQWARVLAFVRRPVLPPRAQGVSRAGLRAAGQLFVLDLVVSGTLLAVGYAVMALGVELPETALAKREIGPRLIALIVLVAPLMEELVFRGWLSGRPGDMLAYLALAGGLAVAVAGGAADGEPAAAGAGLLVMAGVPVLAVIAASLAIFLLRRRGAMSWFASLFPLFFWLSAIVFAGAHIINFGGENLALVLPLVLPQFVLALILAYARVTYGLWSSTLLHMLHNGAVLAIALVAIGQ